MVKWRLVGWIKRSGSSAFRQLIILLLDHYPEEKAEALDHIDLVNFPGAEEDFNKALNLNPNDTLTLAMNGTLTATLGRFDEAIAVLKRALELDPLSSFNRFCLGRIYCIAGQFDRAINFAKETLDFDPDDAHVHMVLAIAYAGKGKYTKAISLLECHRNVPADASFLGYLYGKAGMKSKALDILDDFLHRSKKGYFSPYFIARVYAGLEEKNKVLEYLDKAYEVHDQMQWLINTDIPFFSMRSDPRWTTVLKKRNLPDWMPH